MHYKYIITVIDISHTVLPSFRPFSLKIIVLYLILECEQLFLLVQCTYVLQRINATTFHIQNTCITSILSLVFVFLTHNYLVS